MEAQISQPPIPDDEQERLVSLRQAEILDTPAEERFDRITRLCQTIFNIPHAELNFIDSDRQWTKSMAGDASKVCDRDESFCAYTMFEDGLTIINDATEDERFQDHPAVVGPPHIRFYMSRPIRSPEGQPLGTLCIYDTEPREVTKDEKVIHEELAAIAEGEVHRAYQRTDYNRLVQKLEEAERRSMIDSLTQLWNRRGILDFLEKELNRSRREQEPISVLMIDIDNFKDINDTYGHPTGDTVLETVSERLRLASRDYDFVGRYGGEEFLVILVDSDRETSMVIAERIRETVGDDPIKTEKGELTVTISIGLAVVEETESVTSEKLVDRADELLYEAKRSGKNCVRVDEA